MAGLRRALRTRQILIGGGIVLALLLEPGHL
jgi:hypothetical protein